MTDDRRPKTPASTPTQANAVPPTIGVTMGDPAGIGPEVVVKALADPHLRRRARFIVFGLNELLVDAADRASIETFWWRVPHDAPPGAANQSWNAGSVMVVDYMERFPTAGFDLTSRIPGPSKAGGEASLGFLSDALRATNREAKDAGHVDAVITAPIAKSSWSLAGMKRFAGHTELLADFARAKRHAMMFVAPKLKVVLATTHLPLMDLRNVLTIGRVFDPIDLADEACREWFGIARPRIAVCGLNPHASEGGMFGDEEGRLIEPAIRQALDVGLNVEGPFPGDTIFNAAIDGQYDVVVAMYHDQGTIPVKLLARDESVNITLGLPFVRTSPDHGTAFDIAGRNVAHPGSMRAAISLAIDIVERQRVRGRVHSTPSRFG